MAADRLIAFLVAEGADAQGHAQGRSLLDHLVGTYEILRRWGAPSVVAHAALLHSVYGTDVYEQALVPTSRRPELTALAGEKAERLAYLFATTPRATLFAGTFRWARELRVAGDEPAPTREELDALVLLHMANLAEQKGSGDEWLVRVRRLAELLIDSNFVRLPSFVAALADFTDEDERLLQRAYAAGLAGLDAPQAAGRQLGLAAGVCPVVAEPCVWLAYLAHRAGDGSTARHWARQACRRLIALGAAWDKRLTFEQWLDLGRALEHLQADGIPPISGARADPRVLVDALASGRQGAPAPKVRGDAGGERFQRYMYWLAEAGGSAPLGIYPDLDSDPWYDPSDFPPAQYLESHSEEIRDEILALDPARFHPESERIRRTGDWDVLFLYERGRRHDDVCDACPVTARGIEAHDTMRTAAGLIYVSRMRPGTHIHAHRGPTNLRLRCHLGIKVPDGECAIRVADETRRWEEGRCLVFDDHFEHEAWNHTDDERIVLIVDLWHPGLSPAEVRSLEGLHRYAYTYARQLGRYWSANAAAARGGAGLTGSRPGDGVR
jgi:Aspartyl/Asparaginyl beta-hydroxylase/Domain of unknown function (DUF6817)